MPKNKIQFQNGLTQVSGLALDLSLAEAMERLLSLALDKVRSAGIIAENTVVAIVDAVMGFAIDMLQSGKRFF